ncbi:MAG: hypothetical protein NZ739_12105 [Verrucomicrobiae bacterium]|nr:hypothetical protein [Verrucomicrobiae bacterium]
MKITFNIKIEPIVYPEDAARTAQWLYDKFGMARFPISHLDYVELPDNEVAAFINSATALGYEIRLQNSEYVIKRKFDLFWLPLLQLSEDTLAAFKSNPPRFETARQLFEILRAHHEWVEAWTHENELNESIEEIKYAFTRITDELRYAEKCLDTIAKLVLKDTND